MSQNNLSNSTEIFGKRIIYTDAHGVVHEIPSLIGLIAETNARIGKAWGRFDLPDLISDSEPVILEYEKPDFGEGEVRGLMQTGEALVVLVEEDEPAVLLRTADPYAWGWVAVDRAVRRGLAAGHNPDQIGLAVTWRWGALTSAEQGAMVASVLGATDAANALRVPFVSVGTDKSAETTIDVVAMPQGSGLEKRSLEVGDVVWLIGETRGELGGGAYAALHGEHGGRAPVPITEALARYRSVYRAWEAGAIHEIIALGSGGLGVALGRQQMGMRIEVGKMVGTVAHDDLLLFSETMGRVVCVARPSQSPSLTQLLMAEKASIIGEITDDQTLTIVGYDGEEIVNLER